MTRTLAPSGSPIHLHDLLSCVTQHGPESVAHLNQRIRTELGTKWAFLLANGRGAMTLLLQCMAKSQSEGNRTTVVIPSYTCYSVAASVLKADLDVLICDINPQTLSYDQEQLESIVLDNVLAIVSSNLYGIPDDLQRLETFAKANGVFLIDDAAQCLGATVDGRPVGSFGDAGILSFDKGKVITSINGGVIVTNNESLANLIELEYQQVEQQSLSRRTIELIKLQAYFLLLHPSFYWLPNSLPFLKLGVTEYDEDYPINRYFESLAPLALAQFSRIQDLNDHRRKCAVLYSAGIMIPDLVENVQPTPNSEPIYLRYPLRICDEEMRDNFLHNCRRLGCSQSYPTSIADVPKLQNRITINNEICSAGRSVASQILTLPTHSYVRPSDIDELCTELTSMSQTTPRRLNRI